MPLLETLDRPLFHWINSGWGNPLFDLLIPAVTTLADALIVWAWVLLIALTGLWRLSRPCPGEGSRGRLLKAGALCLLYASLVYGAVSGVNNGLKHLCDRSRPFLQQSVVERVSPEIRAHLAQSGSFPSGHACNAFLVATLLAAQWRRGRFLFFSLATLIAISRVYLGVHYPSDVVAGGLIGWLGTGLLLRIQPLRLHVTGFAALEAGH